MNRSMARRHPVLAAVLVLVLGPYILTAAVVIAVLYALAVVVAWGLEK